MIADCISNIQCHFEYIHQILRDYRLIFNCFVYGLIRWWIRIDFVSWMTIFSLWMLIYLKQNIEIGCDLMIDGKKTCFSWLCFLVQWLMNIHFFHYHHKFFHLYFLYTTPDPIFSPIAITIKISFITKTYDRSNWKFSHLDAYSSFFLGNVLTSIVHNPSLKKKIF